MYDHKERLVDLLKSVERDSGRSRAFEHFLIMMAVALSNRFDRGTLVAQEREERYLEVANKYKREEVRRFSDAGAELIMALENSAKQKCVRINTPSFHATDFEVTAPAKVLPGIADILGDISGEFGLSECDTSQSVDVSESEYERNGFWLITGGSCSAPIYKALNRLVFSGFNPQERCLVIAGDIDERRVLMMYIQLGFYGIPAIVTQRGEITGEELSPPWKTPMFVRDGWADKYRKRDPPVPSVEESLPEIGQLRLF